MSSMFTSRPERVLVEPSQAGISRRPAIEIFSQPRDRAVVNHFALLVAPAAINHLPHGHFVDVARNHAVHELCRIAPADQVFEKRRHINQRRRIPDRVVLVLVMHLVHAHRVIARPLAIIHALAKLRCPVVNRCSNRHCRSWFRRNQPQLIRARIIVRVSHSPQAELRVCSG